MSRLLVGTSWNLATSSSSAASVFFRNVSYASRSGPTFVGSAPNRLTSASRRSVGVSPVISRTSFGATVLALVAGRALAERISERTLSRLGAVAFAIVGVLTLVFAVV